MFHKNTIVRLNAVSVTLNCGWQYRIKNSFQYGTLILCGAEEGRITTNHVMYVNEDKVDRVWVKNDEFKEPRINPTPFLCLPLPLLSEEMHENPVLPVKKHVLQEKKLSAWRVSRKHSSVGLAVNRNTFVLLECVVATHVPIKTETRIQLGS